MNQHVLFRISVLLLLMILVAGCRKTPKGTTKIPGNEGVIVGGADPAGLLDTPLPGAPGGPGGAGGAGGPGGGLILDPDGSLGPGGMGSFTDGGNFDQFGEGESVLPPRGAMAGMTPDRETLARYKVYFGFDRSGIVSQELAKVEAVADYLMADDGLYVKIEGHCDERGTDEYNRALGERRALSLRELLVQMGVSSDRITTESWGEDRPAVEGMDSNAYAMNRRGEFILLRP